MIIAEVFELFCFGLDRQVPSVDALCAVVL
ncbi:MAG: hypothetical protein ACI88C_002636 [Acidimicrobiales bacterium]|jgi:hypothetical protein